MSHRNGAHRLREKVPRGTAKARSWWKRPQVGVWAATAILAPLIVATFGPAIGPAGVSALRSLGVLHYQLPFSWAVTRLDDACAGWLFNKGTNEIPAWNPQGPASPTKTEMWALHNGGADLGGGSYSVALQGGTSEDVVIQDVRVRVLSRTRARHGTEIYAGYGCGGGLPSQDFSVDLDRPSLALVPESGATKWPYVISSGADPEYLVLNGRLKDLHGGFEYRFVYEIDWSQGSRSGTVTVLAPDGKPFTAASSIPGDHAYYGNGGTWIPLQPPQSLRTAAG